MGLKDGQSFLKYVTMGAKGSRLAMDLLTSTYGHSIIELERYSTSNKIWNTKIKRLRLADLVCVNCGIRFEVKVKTNLEIKMSHTETNVDRAWNAGLRDEDVIVFLANIGTDEDITISHHLNCFQVNTLTSSQASAVLGKPKSASEGAERDLTWASYKAPQRGRVTGITSTHLQMAYENGRNYSYPLRGKTPYLSVDETFYENEEIIAGIPSSKFSPICAGNTLQLTLLPTSPVLDLFVSVKCVASRQDLSQLNQVRLLINHEDIRLRLEVYGSIAKLGDIEGINLLVNYALNTNSPEQYVMESVFILTEISSNEATSALERIFDNCIHPEVKAACIWSLSVIFGNLTKALANLHLRSNIIAQHLVIALSISINNQLKTTALLNLLDDERNIPTALEIVSRAKNIHLNTVIEKILTANSNELKMNLMHALSSHPIDQLESQDNFLLLPEESKNFFRSSSIYKETNWAINEYYSDELDLLALQMPD